MVVLDNVVEESIKFNGLRVFEELKKMKMELAMELLRSNFLTLNEKATSWLYGSKRGCKRGVQRRA